MTNKLCGKTILFISGGLEAIPAVQHAKKLGLEVVVSDRDKHAPAFKFADYKLIADTYDSLETLNVAREFHEQKQKIDGVICVAADVPKTVATVAQGLGLPGISVQAATLASDKLLMKDQFKRDGVPIPWYTPVESIEELKRLVGERGLPMVLKPVDSRGARGVLCLTADIDLKWAFHESVQYSPTNRVMLEQYLDGPQVSTESILINGIAYTPGFADRNYELMDQCAPFVIEDGGDLPSCLDENIQEEIKLLVQRAATSMGITNGVVKGDIVVHGGKPHVIELAARLSGGYFCTHEIPLNTGVDFVGAAIKLALGITLEENELKPKFNKYVCQRYFFPKEGRVTRIEGVEQVSNRATTEFLDVRLKLGDIVKPIHNHLARGGMVICSGNSRQDALDNALRVVSEIKIVTQ